MPAKKSSKPKSKSLKKKVTLKPVKPLSAGHEKWIEIQS